MDQLHFDFGPHLPPTPPDISRALTPRAPVRPDSDPFVPKPCARNVSPVTNVLPHPVLATVASAPLPAEASAAATASPPTTIAEVMARLATVGNLADLRRRNMMSSLRKVCCIAGKPADQIEATATSLRGIFAGSSPVMCGVSKSRWNNLLCLSLDALHR